MATQEECMNICAEETDCIGYAHSTGWCLIYGAGLDAQDGVDYIDPDVDGDDGIWWADSHSATTITQTKPNVMYICGVKNDEFVDGFTPSTGACRGPGKNKVNG
jgi:hypothetical protein